MAQSKSADRNRTRSQPLTLAALEEYDALAGFVPPTGDFDSEGPWKHVYRLWLVASGGLAPKPADMHYRGFLEVDRKPSPNGKGITLSVHQSILQHTPGVHDTRAIVACAADDLTSPRSWKLIHTVFDGRLKPVPEGRVEQHGKLTDDTLRIDDGRGCVRSIKLPAARLTSNWSLLDAVGRLPRQGMPPLQFAMLQELDQLKESQQVSYRGSGDHVLNGKTVTLHRYQHTGRGILPYDYYTDAEGRLLVAIGGLRAYILDPHVRELHKQCLGWFAGRAVS